MKKERLSRLSGEPRHIGDIISEWLQSHKQKKESTQKVDSLTQLLQKEMNSFQI